MAKPYWYKHEAGFVLSGERLHREELKTINAQLAAPISSPNRLESESGHDVVAHIASRPHIRYNRTHSTTIFEKFQPSPSLLKRMAEAALKNAIPENWHLNKAPLDGAQELHRTQRIDLLQSLGEAALEESAA